MEKGVVATDVYMKIKAINIIETQLHFVMNLTINIDYLIKLDEIQQNGRQNILLPRGYVNHIARLVMDDIILKIYKLVYDDNYSFKKLKSESHKIGGVKERPEFNLFNKQTKDILKICDELNFRNLRNHYVAHHDEERQHIPANIHEWKKVIDLIFEAYNNAYFLLTNSQISWDNDKQILSELLDDNALLLEFILKDESQLNQ